MAVETRWNILVVLGAFVQLLVATGPVYNFSVFLVSLRGEFQTTALFTGWLGSLGSASLCVGAPLAGVVGSKIGNLSGVVLGAVLASLGYLLTSFIPSLVYGYLTYGVTAGLGCCFAFFNSSNILLEMFPHPKSCCRATGVALVGSSVGIMASGPILNTLNAAYGWRNTFRMLSGFSIVVQLVAALPFLKSGVSGRNHTDESLADKEAAIEGQTKVPDEVIEEPEENLGQELDDCKKVPDVIPPTADEESVNSGWWRSLVRVLLNVEVWLLVGSTSWAQVGWTFVIVYYSSFVAEMGLSTDQISLGLTAFGCAEIGSKILFSAFADRLPCLKLYVTALSCFGGAICSSFLSLASNFQHAMILSILLGMFRGGLYGCTFVTSHELFHRYGPRVVTTLALFGYGIGILAGSPIIGALYDSTGDYTASLRFLVASFVMALVFVLLIPIKRKIQACWSGRSGDCTDGRHAESPDKDEQSKDDHHGTSNPAYEIEMEL